MKNYNPENESIYIMYLDANNLYGWAMSQPLPYKDFKWLDCENINKTPKEWIQHFNAIYQMKCKGYLLEVDLEYPSELHDLHNDYRCTPEKIRVTDEMLSFYCKSIKNKFKINNCNVKKLIPTLNDKEKCVLHYRNLQLYLSLGLRLKKVHRVLEFSESPWLKWLKKYIDCNAKKRAKAKNAFEKDFFKLMNNSVFGKTMENIRKRCNVKLVTDPDVLLKLTSKPTYVSSKIFHENLVAVNMKVERLKLDKPSYVGICVF